MTLRINPALEAALASPIMTAGSWLQGVDFPADRPLINLAQAAPSEPPPLRLREAMAKALLTQTDAHLYGAVLGRDDLRAEVARQWSEAYEAEIAPDDVSVTTGCNQAFCAAISSLAGAGDEVILPTPWYFNHKMWLDMIGATAVPLPTGEDCLPDPAAAEALVTERTRAIALVTPNNPTGAEYPAALLSAFDDLCARRGLTLIVDETYRDFDSRSGPPHTLFAREGWRDRFIHLYSFSKAYRLTGHRVGAVITSPARLFQMEKFIDTVTICPNQIGQIGALEGLKTLSQFVAGERAELIARRDALKAAFDEGMNGWRICGAGAYFAYLEHPFDMGSEALAQQLVRDQSLLLLPGTFFAPPGDAQAERTVRVAYANVGIDGIREAMARLKAFAP
ncbi:MAG: aminotransferase [Pseudomonadota bacterium]